MRLVLYCFLAFLWLTNFALAQGQATLVADSVTVTSSETLIASGHVEVYFQGQRLTASRIEYDRTDDRLMISGPIRIDDGNGNVFLAEQAELSADLTEGLLRSARLVLNQRLQLATSELMRSDGGNLTAMRRVVASSCTICVDDPTPLWEIRAREVVHDAAARQIYFTDATLRFYGVPVLYLPTLRVPDPTMNRATGFLIPRLRSTTALGTGLKLPYFITLGDSRDLTLTPYLSFQGNQTAELRYRQAYANGDIVIEGAATRDERGQGNPRGYVQATGDFDLGNDFQLGFKGITVTDPAYLLDYGVTEVDRLNSQIALNRTRRDLNFSTRLIGFKSIRDGDANSTLPTTVSDLSFERRFDPAFLGGAGGIRLDSHSDYRSSQSKLDNNGDGVADGRDLERISVAFDWRRNWITPSGLTIAATTAMAADAYSIVQDADFAGSPHRVSGAAGIEVRWPLVRTGPNGETQFLEPILQLVSSTPPSTALPNGDSTLVEFDEGNLFALDRYPGADAVEAGVRLNLGVAYHRDDPEGWSWGATAGRVVRTTDDGQFSAASGLSGQTSDWLLAWSVDDDRGLAVTNRLVVDDTLSLTKAEMRFDYANPSMTLSGGYEYLLADASEDRTETASEIVLAARHKLATNWTADLATRYDLRAQRFARAGLDLDFRNECLALTLSLSRRYTSSTSVKPSTDFGLSVELLGFGGRSEGGPSRVCGL
jgi:LPS-assembly protein